MVLVRIAPQRRSAGVRRYVIWPGQMQGKACDETCNLSRRIAKQPECLRLPSQPMADQLRLPITLSSPRHGEDLVYLR
jgi:hypothetical protein